MNDPEHERKRAAFEARLERNGGLVYRPGDRVILSRVMYEGFKDRSGTVEAHTQTDPKGGVRVRLDDGRVCFIWPHNLDPLSHERQEREAQG